MGGQQQPLQSGKPGVTYDATNSSTAVNTPLTRGRPNKAAANNGRRGGAQYYSYYASSITLRQGYAQAPGGQASLLSCIANLLNTIVGAGICSMPFALSSAGIVPGVLLIILCGMTSYFGLHLLTRCAARIGGTRTSFFAVASAALPRGARFDVRPLIDGAIAVKCFGVSISYLIISGQLMPQIVLGLVRVLGYNPESIPAVLYGRQVWIYFWVLLLTPLCFLRRLDSLRHTSYLSFMSVCYLVLIVIHFYIVPPVFSTTPSDDLQISAVQARIHTLSTPPPLKSDWHWFNMDKNFPSVFPVYVFAFTCAQNVFSVYNELHNPTESRTNTVLGSSIGLAGFLYQVVAILGYVTFGSSVSNNIITSYPSDSLFVCGGRLAIVALTLMGYPLQVHPCRASLDKILSRPDDPIAQPTGTPSSPPQTSRPASDEGTPTHWDLGYNYPSEHSSTINPSSLTIPPPHPEMGSIKWALLTIGIVTGSGATALAVEDLSVVLSFVGAIGSTSISFILPGALYFIMFRSSDPADETPEGPLKTYHDNDDEEDEEVEGEEVVVVEAENVPPSKELTRLRIKRRIKLTAALILSIWGMIVLTTALTANVLKLLS